MQHFSLRFKRATGVRAFHSAALSSMLSVSESFLLIRMAWPDPQNRVLTVTGLAVLALLLIVQVTRIHRIYKVAYPQAEGNPVLKRTLNEMLRTYLWGNVIFSLLVLAVFQFSLSHK